MADQAGGACNASLAGRGNEPRDKGYAGRACAQTVGRLDATIVRPTRRDEADPGPHPAPIRQRIESILWTCKDLLTLERRGARSGVPLHAVGWAGMLPLGGARQSRAPP